jgi:hypothetical protein
MQSQRKCAHSWNFDDNTMKIFNECCNNSGRKTSGKCLKYSSLCSNDHDCVDTEDDYECKPKVTNEKPKKIDICSRYSSLCEKNEICINTETSYACRCQNGYVKNIETDKCEDVNECEEETHDCRVNEICKNTEGAFECLPCSPEYRIKNSTCIEDVCYKYSCLNFCEVNEKNEPVCKPCQKGFHLVNGECVDRNECLERKCGEKEICTNLIGSYRCEKIECGKFYTNGIFSR